MKPNFLLSFLLFLVFSFSSIAGTRDPNTPDERYLEFGKQFKCVQRLRVFAMNDEDKKVSYQFGSAVIIRPNWALTAAHVVANSKNCTLITDEDVEFQISHVIAHAEFKDAPVGFHDIALCYSPKDFQLEFYTPLYTDSDEVGKAATISGYGLGGTFNTGGMVGDGKKRAGHNVIDQTTQAILICTPSKTGRLPLEFCITPGDSGGGLFIGNKLAGINSFLMAMDEKPNGSYSDEAAHTRVSMYVDWINNQITAYELAVLAQSTIAPPEIILIESKP